MKAYTPVLLVVGACLILYNKFPTEVTVFLSLILVVLIINKWDVLQKNFS